MPDLIGPSAPDWALSPLPPDYGSEFDAAMLPDLQASRAANVGARDALAQQYKEVLAAISGMQGPAPLPVPPAMNPALTGLAGFFAFLNQAQGGGGTAPAALMNTLAQNASYRRATEAANAETAQRFQLGRLEATERTHEKFLEMMRDNAVDANNLEAAYQHQKSLYQLQEKQFKRRLDETNAAKENLAQANSARILDRWKTQEAGRRQRDADRRLQFQKDLVAAGLKMTPAQLGRQRTIYTQGAQQRDAVLRNAQANMLDWDTQVQPQLDAIEANTNLQLDLLMQEVKAGTGEAPKNDQPKAATPKEDPLGIRGKK